MTVLPKDITDRIVFMANPSLPFYLSLDIKKRSTYMCSFRTLSIEAKQTAYKYDLNIDFVLSSFGDSISVETDLATSLLDVLDREFFWETVGQLDEKDLIKILFKDSDGYGYKTYEEEDFKMMIGGVLFSVVYNDH